MHAPAATNLPAARSTAPPRAAEALAEAFDALEAGIAVVDAQNRLRACNRTFQLLTGIPEAMLVPGEGLDGICRSLARTTASTCQARLLACIGTVLDHEATDAKHRHDDGTLFEIRYMATDGGGAMLVIEDATERERTLAQLRQAKDEAEVVNRGKSAFLANMSHELRTPLNAIIGFADIIKDQMFGPVGSERYAEYADEIRRSGHGLLAIINDIIDVSRIEAGQFMLRETVCDVGELVGEAVARLAAQAKAGQVALEVDTVSALPPVKLDQRAMRQVLDNLLSNAVKFTLPGGRVTVAARVAEEGLEIAVTDTGIGVAQEQIARLGQPFYQVDGALARSHQGTGLGLALVKSLMSLHGGTLAIQSTLGHGTRAAVTLPTSRIAS